MKPTHCVGYNLHKDKSPIVQDCFSEAEQTNSFEQLKKEGYTPIKMTPEEAADFLNKYGERFKPKPLTQQQRWEQWALGN